MDDRKIIEMYLNRDERAILYTDKKYRNYLYTISFHILNKKENTEECLNDTYLKTWMKIPPFIPKKFNLFLGKIIRELSIDYYRKLNADKRREGIYAISLEELGEIIADEREGLSELERKELVKIIEDFLRGLNSEKRDIFIMRYFFFDSINHIGRSLNISEGAVKTRLYRIRKELKERLIEEGYIWKKMI